MIHMCNLTNVALKQATTRRLDTCQAHDMEVLSWSPLGEVVCLPVFGDVSETHAFQIFAIH